MKFDLIGDIHGHCEPLLQMLETLGYTCVNGIHRHPQRRAIFLGDFIDRGPDQRGVIEVVRPMIDAGAALAVMGNHEFNAIAYDTEHPAEPGKHLRVHNDKHVRQHRAFMEAYAAEAERAALLRWFRSLPLFLDLTGLRVVHACWDSRVTEFLTNAYPCLSDGLSDDLLHAAATPGTREFAAIETLLKGKEIRLPGERMYHDKDGNARRDMRMRWWDGQAGTYREAFLGPDAELEHIPDEPMNIDRLDGYATDEPPVFIAHYRLQGRPEPLAPNVACLDYSVEAAADGKLVAYRWEGEQRLREDRFVVVERIPGAASFESRRA